MKPEILNPKSLFLLVVGIFLVSPLALIGPHWSSHPAGARAGLAFAASLVQAPSAKLNVGLSSEGVAKGPDGRYYVSLPNNPIINSEPGKGKIVVILGDPFAGTATVSDFVTGLNRPLGIVFVGSDLFVADINMVWKISVPSGEKSVYLAPSVFPGGNPLIGIPGGALRMNGIDADAQGNLYMTDSNRSVIWKATRQPDGTARASIFLNNGPVSPLTFPNNVLVDAKGVISGAPGGLLVTDTTNHTLVAIAPDASTAKVLATDLGGADGMTFDTHGNLYIADASGGRIFRMKPDRGLEVFEMGVPGASDIWVDKEKGWLIAPSNSTPTMTFFQL